MKKKHLISIAIAALLLFYLLYRVPLDKTVEILQQTNQIYVAIAGLMAVVLLFIRVAVWGLFLDAYKIKVRTSHLISTFLASQFLANITPGRVGEISRPYFLKRRYGTSFFRILPSIIIERFFDVTTLLIFSSLLLLGFSSYTGQIITVVSVFAILCIVIIFLLIFNRKSKVLSKLVIKLLKSFKATQHLQKKAEELIDNFYNGVRTIRSARLFQIFMIIAFGWVFDALILYLCALSILPAAQLPSILLIASFMGIAVLGGTLSSLPGGLGSTDAIFFLLFTSIGISEPASLSITLVYRLAGYIFPILFCTYFFYIEAKHQF